MHERCPHQRASSHESAQDAPPARALPASFYPFTIHYPVLYLVGILNTECRRNTRLTLNGYAFALGLRRLGQMDFEHAVAIAGFNLVRVGSRRQRHGTVQAAFAVAEAVRLVLVFLLLFRPDGQLVAADLDVKVFGFKSRSVGPDHDLGAGVFQVEAPEALQSLPIRLKGGRPGVEKAIEQRIELVPKHTKRMLSDGSQCSLVYGFSVFPGCKTKHRG